MIAANRIVARIRELNGDGNWGGKFCRIGYYIRRWKCVELRKKENY